MEVVLRTFRVPVTISSVVLSIPQVLDVYKRQIHQLFIVRVKPGELFPIPEELFIEMLRLSGKKHFFYLIQPFFKFLKIENILLNEEFKEIQEKLIQGTACLLYTSRCV